MFNLYYYYFRTQPAPDGDFVITTRLVAAPNENFQQAGIFLILDGVNYVSILSAFCEPWLASSLDTITQTLRFSGTLGWLHSDTPYEKEIDSDGITTEFICCVARTDSGIVIKVIRTKICNSIKT